MRSPHRAEDQSIDLARDVPTTRDDIAVLRQLRQTLPSWLALPPDVLETWLPAGALDRRPPTSARARPFELPALVLCRGHNP